MAAGLVAGSFFSAQAQTPTFNLQMTGICDSMINSEWRNNQWNVSNYILFDLDADDYLLEMRSRDSLGDAQYRLVFTRNANDDATEANIWVKFGGSFINYARTTFTYDANQNMIFEASKTLFPVPADQERYTYTYDANDYLIGSIRERYQSVTWEKSLRTTYTNNANGQPTETIEESWNASINDWMYMQKTSTNYNAAGKELSW
ncbi:MAG: hypothetical protein ACR2KB_06165, partial [Chitinophagaceae bacterium]